MQQDKRICHEVVNAVIHGHVSVIGGIRTFAKFDNGRISGYEIETPSGLELGFGTGNLWRAAQMTANLAALDLFVAEDVITQ